MQSSQAAPRSPHLQPAGPSCRQIQRHRPPQQHTGTGAPGLAAASQAWQSQQRPRGGRRCCHAPGRCGRPTACCKLQECSLLRLPFRARCGWAPPPPNTVLRAAACQAAGGSACTAVRKILHVWDRLCRSTSLDRGAYNSTHSLAAVILHVGCSIAGWQARVRVAD